ncbi:hypothetical protein OAO87_03220 [bacterium]|nr:hypothetical protein [bacterium]
MWLDRIVDNVFLRAEHFGLASTLPPAAAELLRRRSFHRRDAAASLAYSPRWANTVRRPGRLRDEPPYVVEPPGMLWTCVAVGNRTSC